MKLLQERTKKRRFERNAPDFMRYFLAIALSAAPNFAIKTAAYIIPLLVTGFLKFYGLFASVGKLENYASTFPSETYLRNNITRMAADNTVWLAEELQGKKVFIQCDKGMSFL